ncbi:MAG: hypothetical protein LBH13_08015, partial [Cellulomonadaceae bacterium]|nr:hypothetical protein [Cellulomonadaceae bacterium]
AERIVDGVQEADNRFEDHPEAGGASAMDVLSVTLDALTEQDVPPGQDAARYTELIAQAREGFTSAGDQLQQGHIAEAAETYMKARTITGDLLVMISGATGTVYVLPAWSFH